MGPNDIQKLNQVAQVAAIDAAKKKAAAAEAAAKLAEDQAKAAQKPTTPAPAIGQQSNEEADEEERGWEARQLKDAAKICVDEFETGEPYHEIVDGVADEHGLDPIQLAKYLHDKGFMEEDELNDFIEYVNNTHGEDSEEAGEEKHNWRECDCEKCKRARYIADHVSDKNDHPDSMKESAQISSFIKSLSQKNYASANKYLQSLVDGKLKHKINKAYNK